MLRRDLYDPTSIQSIKNMKRMIMLTVLFSVIGCAPQLPPASSDVHGKYEGTYGGGVEVFDIRADGTFSQVLKVGQHTIYTNSGTWRIEGQYVVFDHVYEAMQYTKPALEDPPTLTDNLRGLWVSSKNWSSIVFNVDVHYQIQKQVLMK